MKNTLFMLFATLVVFAVVIMAATQVYLSKTSKFSRASDNSPTSSQPAN